MDFTNVKCISESCKDKDVVMGGAGGQFGGRINFAKLRCPVCDTVLLILPMNKEYQYSIEATTKEEREELKLLTQNPSLQGG